MCVRNGGLGAVQRAARPNSPPEGALVFGGRGLARGHGEWRRWASRSKWPTRATLGIMHNQFKTQKFKHLMLAMSTTGRRSRLSLSSRQRKEGACRLYSGIGAPSSSTPPDPARCRCTANPGLSLSPPSWCPAPSSGHLRAICNVHWGSAPSPPLVSGGVPCAVRALCEKLAVLHHREFGKFRRLKERH